MQPVVYDGSFEGWLCAVFDVYYYKFTDVAVYPQHTFQDSLFKESHIVKNNQAHAKRVWDGLEKKLSADALGQIHRTFLSELPGIETILLQYVQYAFAATSSMEMDYSHPAVLGVTKTAKKVWKEKHRMEAFVRFQRTKDDLYYSIVEPDYNVLPIISKHFEDRYADQRWLIYDAKRSYGIYYNLYRVSQVEMNFAEGTNKGKDVGLLYDDQENIYQQLWQQYFKSVNIAARKNTKLHIQHMPVRYWKHMIEKRTGPA